METISAGTHTYSYDEAGNLVSRFEQGRNITTTLVYDEAGRIRSKTYTGTTPAVAYCYDGSTSGGCAGAPGGGSPQNLLGRLTMVANGVSTTKYSAYDALGRVVSQAQTVAGQSYPFSNLYDHVGVTQVTYPSGRAVTYAYDGAGRVSSAASGATEYAGSITYAPHGAVEQLRLGNGRARQTESSRL